MTSRVLRPVNRRDREQPVLPAQGNHVLRVVGLRNLTAEKAPAKAADLVTVQITQRVAHEGRCRRRPRRKAVRGKRVEDLRFVDVFHATEDKYV